MTSAEFHLIKALELLRRYRALHMRFGIKCDCDVCTEAKALDGKVGQL
jgi:hypothetical protein